MDDNRALSILPKLWIVLCTVVGEHSDLPGSRNASSGGAFRKANVGISNDKTGAKPVRRKTKVS